MTHSTYSLLAASQSEDLYFSSLTFEDFFEVTILFVLIDDFHVSDANAALTFLNECRGRRFQTERAFSLRLLEVLWKDGWYLRSSQGVFTGFTLNKGDLEGLSKEYFFASEGHKDRDGCRGICGLCRCPSGGRRMENSNRGIKKPIPNVVIVSYRDYVFF